jgi:hypothetical protein
MLKDHYTRSFTKHVSALSKPLTAIVTYIIITLLFNLFGPWEYAGFNAAEVVLFMAAFLGLVIVGYIVGIRSTIQPSAKAIRTKRVFFYFSIAIVVVIFFKILLLVENLRNTPIVSLAVALLDLGNTYKTAIEAQRLIAYQEVSLIGQLNTLIGLGTMSVTVLGFYYFSELSKLLKYLFVLMIVLIVSLFLLFRGTQIVFANLFIYWVSVEAILRLRSGTPLFNRRTVLASVAILGVLMIIQMSRMNAYSYDASSLSTNRLLTLNTNHVLFRVLGSDIGLSVSLIVSYVSMGYYGLSLSFAEPFVWTYGLGSSFALSGYAEQYLKMDPQLNSSYPFRVEWATRWPAMMYWQTAFPWLASDLSYPGTLVFLGVVAYAYARALKEAVLHNNLLSVVFFANLNILWLFLPANNQLMQERESAIAAILLTILWLAFHNRFNGPQVRAQEAWTSLGNLHSRGVWDGDGTTNDR